MYETFYNLNADPFRLSPDIRFCFGHSGHNEARAYLSYALKLGEGFILITGRPGTGKTTLIQVFLKELELSQVVAESIAASNLKAAELLRAVAYAFNIEVEGLDKATLRRRIQQFFAQQVRAGKRMLLIIDEAQGLSHAALEELRLLADLQTGSRPLLQLFLVGQEKLRDLMRTPTMEQFQQRVIGTFHLKALDLAETRAYVEYRLRQADWKGDPEITGAALLGIYRYSAGVPRHINKICTRLFLHGFMEGRHKLDADDVVAISAGLHEEQLAPIDTDMLELPDTSGNDSLPEGPDGQLALDELAVRCHAPQAASPDKLSAAKLTAGAPQGRSREHPRPAASRRSAVAPQARPVREPNPQRVRRPETVGLKAAARQLSIEVARTVAGRFNWLERKGVSLATIALVSLAVLTLSGLWEQQNHDQGYLFVEHSQPATAAARAPGNSETAHSVSLEHERDEPAALEVTTTPTRASVAGQPQAVVQSDADHGDAGSGVRRQAAAAPGVSEIATSPRSLATHVPSDRAILDPPVASSAGEADRAVMEASRGDTGAALQPALAAVVAVPPASRDLGDANAEAEAIEAVPGNHDATARVAAAAPGAAPPVTSASVSEARDQPVRVTQSATPSPTSQQRKIAKLLSLARRALDRDRLLVPARDNAYDYYQQVLVLQPGNSVALAGMERIVERYAVLAKRALDREDQEKASLYVARGLRVQPGEARLLAVQERINRMKTALLTASAEPEPRAPVVVPEAKQEARGFLSRLKGFFRRGQSGSEADDRRATDPSW